MTSLQVNNGTWRPLTPKSRELLMSMPGYVNHRPRDPVSHDPSIYHRPRINGKTISREIPQFGEKTICSNGTATKPLPRKHDVRVSEEDVRWMMSITEAFTKIAGEDGLISFEEFKNAIDVKEELFARRYFKFFDEDESGTIELKEFITKTRHITCQTDEEKLKFLFEIFDDNGDGIVTHDELKVVLGACLSESSLRMSDQQLNSLASVLLRAADKNCDGIITYDELCDQFKKYPALIENLAISPSNWLKLNKTTTKTNRWASLSKSISNALHNNKPLVGFFFIHMLLTIVCFAVSVVRYRKSNWCVIIARGAGMALNYNGMAIGLAMARRTLTYIRNTPIGPYLPIDHHIEIHKFIGVMVAVLSAIHTVAHLGNIGIQISTNSTRLSYTEYLFTTKAGVGWFFNSAYISGNILALVLLLVVLCSLPVVRKSGRFEFFYWTHLLYMVFWLVLMVHGPIFWIWFLLPGVLLFGEKTYSMVLYCLQKTSYGSYFIEEVNLLPSKVTHLVVSRPPNFQFRAGDYVFIRIPTLSKWEWHPFSISSAPEQEGVLWFHIRSLGNWTKHLYEFYDTGEYIKTMEFSSGEGTLQQVARKNMRRPTQPNPFSSMTKKGHRSFTDRRKVYIDGPFGSPTARMGDTNHAILIAAGIGVTPFASVLQSLLTQQRRAREAEKKGSTDGAGPRYGNSFKLKKIDFIWVNRMANDFEWFIDLLTQLEIEESRQGEFDRFLDIHLYMTAAKSKSDLKGVGLQMALELVHQEAKLDLITGLRTRTKAGRPNWKEIFRGALREKKGDVHVYFCGSPALAANVEEECNNFDFTFSHSF